MPHQPPTDPLAALADYLAWLDRQPLAPNSRRAYRGRVTHYCAYLAATPSVSGDPLAEPHARDYAVRDFKAHLKTVRRAKPTSVNLALAAIDSFYGFLGLGHPQVRREDLPQAAPRALTADEQKQFLRAVERQARARDRAIATLFFYTALRLGECVALNTDDVALTARKGKVIVRSGKGDVYREVPLNSAVRAALTTWMAERRRLFPDSAEPALFLNRAGRRLSARAIDQLLRKTVREAGLALSAHVLRHTCLTNLVRGGHDLVLVAEIAGHRRLETTRRYSLPTAQDRQRAMESLRVEY
ncbi:MAG TPA: tyrosine-type recombinase/integrase [Chloroflexota bacterium]|nr:tyrosine-type recombinase/integrase [Chloroflexota bacterium]